MLLLVLTNYLFFQGPRAHLWAWHNLFVPYQRLFPVFDRLASLDRPRFLRCPKKKKKAVTHNLKTLSVYSAIQSMFCHPFYLFTFDFNHVSSFPGSTCYYAEVLGLLVRDFSIFFGWIFFSSLIDRRKDPKSGNALTVNRKR